MKKDKYIKVIILICFFMIILFSKNNSLSYAADDVSSPNIYKLSNPEEICDAVKEKDVFTINIYNSQGYEDKDINEMLEKLGIDSLESIGIKKIDKYNYQIMTPDNECYNADYRDAFVGKVSKGMDYPPWVYIGRMHSDSTAYVDDVKVEEEGKLKGNYSFLRIINAKRKYDKDSKLTWDATRKPTEKIYLSINLSEKNLKKTDTNNDLRLSFSYGVKSGDTNIGKYDSVAYYLYDKETEYGPYKFEYVNLEKVFYEKLGEKSSKISIYNIISENLFKEIPEGTTIDKIKIIPYEFYSTSGGELKLYDLSIDKYPNNYIPNKDYLSIAASDLNNYKDTEDLMRHRIIDDRMTQGLVKWRGSDDSRIMRVCYSSAQASLPIDFDSGIKYGFPYTTAAVTGSTLYSFLGQMTYDEEEKIYEYHIPTTYKNDIYAVIGGTGEEKQHSKGEEIEGVKIDKKLYVLFVLNTNGEMSTLYTRYKNDLKKCVDFTNPKIPKIEFISNNDAYVYGHSCSTSVYIPIARQIPTMTYVSSYDYFYNGDVEMVNLDLTFKEVETALRCTGTLNSESFMTTDIFNKYYTSVIKLKYTEQEKYPEKEQEIYNAYALAIPGDTFSHPGHVRIVSGYSNVVCEDETVFNKGTYTDFACKNHGGINPEKSYVITTEGGTSFVNKGNVGTNYDQHIKSYETGWSYILDSRYTDITDVDQIYCTKLQVDDPTLFNNLGCTKYNIKTNFRPNFKYTFAELFGGNLGDADTGEDISDGNSEEGDNNENGSELAEGLNCPSYLENKDLSVQKGIYLPFRYKEVDRVKDTSLIENTNIKLFLDKEYSNEEMFNWIKTNKKIKGTIISNYLIDGIKFEINDEQHYIYPNMTHTFSLYRELDDFLLEKLSNLDYSKTLNIKVSVKSGPEFNVIKEVFGNNIDDDYYITILDVHSPQVHYYQGNATGNVGTTKFSKVTECAFGENCTLASYKNLTNKSFPQSSYGWKFAGYSTLIDGTNIDFTGGETIIYDGTNDLELYVVGVRNFRFSSGIAPTNNSGNIPQYWNPYKMGTEYITTINVPNAISIEGWEFIGYRANNTASSTITIKASDKTYKGLPTNLTAFDFRGIYKRDITLNFDSNGGEGEVTSITKSQYYNSGFGNNDQNMGDNISTITINLPENGYTREGYTFKGWSEDVNGTNIILVGENYNLNPSVTDINVTKTLYAIWEESYDYTIKKYEVDNTNKYISKIKVNTDIEEYKKNIEVNIGYRVEVENKKINNKKVLYTGGKTRIYKGNELYKEYINVVIGDINGDGMINSAELLKIRQHLLKTNILTGYNFLATDINYDNIINSADLLRVQQHLLGTRIIG